MKKINSFFIEKNIKYFPENVTSTLVKLLLNASAVLFYFINEMPLWIILVQNGLKFHDFKIKSISCKVFYSYFDRYYEDYKNKFLAPFF